MGRSVMFAVLAIVSLTGHTRAGNDALAEVNATRAARGLRPYIKDADLTSGAENVADFRAARLITGHTINDFAGLPPGCTARSAGCAAWEPSFGWGACCT